MNVQQSVGTRFTVAAPSAGVAVDVHLHAMGVRWVAEARRDGRPQTGIGATPREALAASLAGLDRAVRRELLADLALLRPSCELLAAAADNR